MSQLQVTGEAKIRDIQGPVVANSGVITALNGVASQYVRGDGTLANFPTSGGGGSSVSYYLNGSVNQGNIGGTVYYQMSKTPVIGAGTNFSIANNDLIAQFITDAGDPALLEIPAGNWNLEMYFNASSNGGNPSFYVELYKYNAVGGFTLISSSSATPEGITNGTAIDLYTTALAVPSTVLSVTDRLMLRVFVNNSGRTITLHTENSHLCQVITTFSTGITALNGLTKQVQSFAVGTSGTDFNIVSSVATHTFNIPNADASNRGLVTTGNQTFGGDKSFGGTTTASNLNVSGVLTVFGNLSNGTFSYTLPSAAGQLALTSQIPTITGTSYIVSRFNLAGTALENSSISDTGTYTGSPTGQVTINSRLAVNNFTELNRYLSIAQNPDQTWVPPTTGVNIELFFNSVTGIPTYAPDSAYIRARNASDDTLRRLFVLGSELILNQNTNGKTLINKQAATQTTTKLEVAGYARFDNNINVIGVLYLNATDASQPTYIQAPSGDLSIVTSGTTYVNSTGSILLRSGGNNGVFIATTGLVGINGATPSEALTVNGGGLFTSPLLVTTNDNNFAFNVQLKNTNAGTQALTGLGLSDLGGTRKGQILWIPSNYVTTSLQNSFLVSSVTNIPLILCADATGAATPNIIFQSGTANKMLLNGTSGNFSIGNTNNTYKLDVSGTGRFYNTGGSNTLVVSGTGSPYKSILDLQYSATVYGATFTYDANPESLTIENYGRTESGTTQGDINFRTKVNNTTPTNVLNLDGFTGAATFSSSVTAGGATAIADALLPIQINSGASSQAYFASNNNGTYGMLIGYDSTNGYARVRNVSNTALTFETNNTEKVRITNGGNVGIGTSSPSCLLHLQKAGGTGSILQRIQNETIDGYSGTHLYGSDGAIKGHFGWANTSAGTLADKMYFGTIAAKDVVFTSNDTERMRITSGGDVLIGKTVYDNTNYGVSIAGTTSNAIVSVVSNADVSFLANRKNTTGDMFLFRYNNTTIGSISTNGTTTSYNITSDYRLKEDYKQINGLEKVCAIKVYDFKWKNSELRMDGVIAHELQEILPYAVNGEKDAIDKEGNESYQGVDYSKIVPILVKSIQELESRIKQLENK